MFQLWKLHSLGLMLGLYAAHCKFLVMKYQMHTIAHVAYFILLDITLNTPNLESSPLCLKRVIVSSGFYYHFHDGDAFSYHSDDLINPAQFMISTFGLY